uniref:Na_H_Exchanger domain-containing protein n=1 Tax=Gongylonema pulchrum TaxID=637853 RepID=A0A183EHZ6_9BILA
LVIAFGSGPAALMKSGCTITVLIAVERICALTFPLEYYSMNRKWFVVPFMHEAPSHQAY